MSNLETVQLNQNILNSPAIKKQTAIHNAQEKKRELGNGIDPLLIAYLLIFDSVQISHNTAAIQAKEVQANALAQNNLINQEALLNFITLSKTALYDKEPVLTDGPGKCTGYTYVPKSDINKIMNGINLENQQISALRSVMEGELGGLKLDAQIKETQVNTVSNEDQQAISEDSSLMNMLVSLTNQISQI